MNTIVALTQRNQKYLSLCGEREIRQNAKNISAKCRDEWNGIENN
jgi:hypothetical protein